MNLQQIKSAVEAGDKVHWSNRSYQVIVDKKGQWLIEHSGGSCIGLTWTDGVTLNGEEGDFYIS